MDTNVLFSSLAKQGLGANRLIRAIQRHHHLLVPAYVMDELLTTTKRIAPDSVRDVSAWLRRKDFQLVPYRKIDLPLPPIADPDDRPILHAALLAKPDFLVTNNYRHFNTPEIKRLFRVESVSGMLRLLGQ